MSTTCEEFDDYNITLSYRNNLGDIEYYNKSICKDFELPNPACL